MVCFSQPCVIQPFCSFSNHWESPTYMVSVEDTSLEGAGYVLKQHIWNAARDTIEEWTGQRLAECSLYGIRVYKSGAILAPHVDRNPLVASAIINVDQDVDEPWPLEVIDHAGKAHNITMLPGDMVLYESHSVIHGRQFPLKGRFMANIFIHFEPIGPINEPVDFDSDLPPYVIRGSIQEEHWRHENPQGRKVQGRNFETGTSEAHDHAASGDYESLKTYLDHKPFAVTNRDKNGWTPLAEAVRTGDMDIARLLIDRGSEVNARVGADENGGSILWLAKELLPSNHPITALLIERGARLVPPSSHGSEL